MHEITPIELNQVTYSEFSTIENDTNLTNILRKQFCMIVCLKSETIQNIENNVHGNVLILVTIWPPRD